MYFIKPNKNSIYNKSLRIKYKLFSFMAKIHIIHIHIKKVNFNTTIKKILKKNK